MLRGKTYASKICPQNKTIFCQHLVMQNLGHYMLHPGRGRYPYLLLILINLMTRNKNDAEAWEAIQTNVSISFTSETQQETLSGCPRGRSSLSSLSTTARWPQRRKRQLSPDHRRTASLPQISFANSASAVAKNQTQRGQKTTWNNKAANNASR